MKLSKGLLFFFAVGVFFTGSSAITYVFSSNPFFTQQVAAIGAVGAPNAPTVVAAIGVSANQITLSWANSQGEIQEASYKIYRNGTQIGTAPYIQDSDIWHEPGIFQDVGLAPDTTYSYFVTAVGADGAESAASMTATARTKDSSQTGIIPSKRKTDWVRGVTVGVPGGIPNRTNIINTANAPYFVTGSPQTTTGSIAKGSNTLTVASIVDFQVGQTVGVRNASTHIYDDNFLVDLATVITGVEGNTITLADAAKASVTNALVYHNDMAAINRAIAEAPAESVVYIPAGTYSGGIYIAGNNVTVRGAGMDRTIVGGTSIRGGGGDGFYNTSPISITSGASWGSRQITVTDASSVSVGRMIQISADNDLSLPEYSMNDAYNHIRKQNFMVTGKSGNTLTLDSPLVYAKYENPVMYVSQSFSSRVGIEDMTINAGGAQIGLSISSVYASWIKNVKVSGASNYTISISDSHMSEIRHSYLAEQSSEGTNHAGLLMGTSAGILFEDNIVLRSFPILEINFGSTGNVFAYNYLVGNMVDSNHGAHNSFNLYEGNIMDGIMSDGYFGSESEQTLFRNWITGRSFGIVAKRFSRNFNIVGNQIGTDGGPRGVYSFGQPNIGNGSSDGFVAASQGIYWRDWPNKATGWPPEAFQERDLDVLASLILKANRYSGISGYLYDVNESLQSGEVLSNSLYLSSKPAFFGDLQWPPFGPNNPSYNEAAIPAGYRYKNGAEAPGSNNDNPPPPPPPSTYSLTISKTGQGTVTGGPISCGSLCTANLAPGTAVTLLATPASGYAFTGWGGACSGSSACMVTLNSNTYVSAVFTSTIGAGPVISSISASSITQSGATITWNTDKQSDTQVEYGLTASYGNVTALNSSMTLSHSQILSNLTPNTTYNFRVKSKDSSGNLSVSPNQTFATLSLAITDTTAPSVPAGLSASSITQTQATVSWNASTDNVGVASYRVYKNGALVGSPVSPTYTLTGLSANTAYSVAVAAVDAAGNMSAKSTALNVLTSAGPVTTYTVSVSKTGSGTVSGSGIDCGATCSTSVTAGTTITIMASPAKNFLFTGWNGACAGQGSQCSITVSRAVSTSAIFRNDNSKKVTELSGSLSRDLSVGTTGSDVLLLQQFLNSKGYVISSTGAGSPGQETTSFGGLTRAAVMRFQAAYGISQTGTVGPLTRARINSLISGAAYVSPATTKTYVPTTYAAPKSSSSLFVQPASSFTQTLKLGSQGAEVVLLQRLLATQTGIYPQKLTNGIFNSDVEAAVQRFQIKYSLAAPGDEGYGVVGPMTRVKLNELWKR